MAFNNLIYDWAEMLGAVFAVFALIIALAINNSPLTYLVISIFGLGFGRYLFHFKQSFKAPPIVVILFFYIGYLLGSISANKIFISALFFSSILLAYKAHDKGFIYSVEY